MKPTYLFFLALITFSCNSTNIDLYNIDPRNFIDNKITLVEMADNIQYIPLDNRIPFKDLGYKLTPDFLYINVKNIGILKFNRQGKLINKIGSIGRGPGEFKSMIQFTVDERTGTVFVKEGKKINVYSNNGTFLKEIPLDKILDGNGMTSGIEIFNSLLFFPHSLETGNSRYAWVFIDTLGNMVASKENSVPPFETNMGRDAVVYKFENRLFYYNYYNDTIFSISPDLSYRGEYLFAQGNFRWPKTIINTRSIAQMNSLLKNTFDPNQMYETKHFMLLCYGYLDMAAFCFINKKTKKTFLAYKNDISGGGYRYSKPYLINDLDEGISLEHVKYYFENGEEFLISLINPFNLLMKVSSNAFKNSTSKYPEMKKGLEKLASSLKETDNPVLVMVRLKE